MKPLTYIIINDEDGHLCGVDECARYKLSTYRTKFNRRKQARRWVKTTAKRLKLEITWLEEHEAVKELAEYYGVKP